MDTAVAHQFDDATQQRETATLAMWVFLATEVLFFGGMFLGYFAYRWQHPHAFEAASNHTVLLAGTVNTALLLISSFCMALAVRAAEQQERWKTCGFLLLTAVLGIGFLVIKSFEYAHEIHEGLLPGAHFHIEHVDRQVGEMFFYLYFLMTGVHALHVTIGLVLMLFFAVRALFTLNLERFSTSVDLLGLYWHFVDIVWVFLFPLIYLGGPQLMKPVASIKHYALIAAALLGLLVLTVGVAYIPMGRLNTPVALLISIAKAGLILTFFMHLKRGSGIVRLYALAGFFWLGILLVLAMNDFFTRP